MCVAGRDLKIPTIVLRNVKRQRAILFTCIHIPPLQKTRHQHLWRSRAPRGSADLEGSMFNVGFCVQHHTLSATLDMFDCVTGDTVRCGAGPTQQPLHVPLSRDFENVMELYRASAELLLRKVHLGACAEMRNGAYTCSDFAQKFQNMNSFVSLSCERLSV